MFYEPAKNDHGLPYNPFKALVVPRPIGWISSLSRKGVVNLAPFSEFNYLGSDPPYVMFSASGHNEGGRKDSAKNAEETGEFVFNLATWELREAVRITGDVEEKGVDEMALAGLTPAPSRLVKPPRVAASPVSFECVHHQTVVLRGESPKATNHVVIGKVIGVYIRDDLITEKGRVDILKVRPLARLGYLDYTTVDAAFEIGKRRASSPRQESGCAGTPPATRRA